MPAGSLARATEVGEHADRNPETGFRKSQAERQPDVASASQDYDVKGTLRRLRGRSHVCHLRDYSALKVDSRIDAGWRPTLADRRPWQSSGEHLDRIV